MLVGQLLGVERRAAAAGRPAGTGTMTRFRFGSSSAGKDVTVERGLGIAAVWACVWLIAEMVGGLPFATHRRDGRAWIPQPSWQDDVLAGNPESTSIDLWGTAITHLESWGNAYVGKEFVNGRVRNLWNIRPERTTVERINGVKVFTEVQDDGSVRRWTAREVLHIKGRSFDGMMGVSPIEWHRQTVGIALALDEFGGSTLRNRAVPLGVLSVRGRITRDGVRETLREEWRDRFRGSQQGEIAILDEDASFRAVSMPLGDAQYVEQRRLSVLDIARIFGLPAEFVLAAIEGSNLTYANVTERASDLVRYTLRSRMTRLEQAVGRDPDLYRARDLAPRLDPGDFFRGDRKTLYEALAKAAAGRQFLELDELRQAADYPPLRPDSPLHSQATPPVVQIQR